MSLTPGSRVLGRYIVVERLGAGAMGTVYRGRHETLDYEVALKVVEIADHGDLANRMSREARAMALVRHPNVVAVLDLGLTDDGCPCFAMELVDGEPLDQRLRRAVAVPWTVAVRFQRDLLAGLAAIHRAGIVHRDVKPANLLVGEGEVLKVADFGIAQLIGGSQLTQTGTTLGTPAYMAPEQAVSSRVDHRADLYSAALVFYELVTGTVPHATGGMMAPIHRMVQGIPPAIAPLGRPAIPAHILATLARALEVDPDHRFQTADELLAAFLDDRVSADGPSRPASRAFPAVAVGALDAEPLAFADAVRATGSVVDAIARAAVRQQSAGVALATVQTGAAMPAIEGTAEPVTLLVVARIPPSRLSDLGERRWLASVARGSRTFTVAAYAWVAVTQILSRAAATARGQAIQAELTARYADSVRCEISIVDEPVPLTAAMMMGVGDLPAALVDLIERVR